VRTLLPAAVTATLAATIVAAYLVGWAGAAIAPWPAVAAGVVVALVLALRMATGRQEPLPLTWPWAAVFVGAIVLLALPAWPALLPRGGASDLTHHLMLVDVIEHTRHLVDGTASEAALGEMAHYTPGLHLLIVIAGALAGVDAFRTAYPLLALTIALKAGFVYLIAHDGLEGSRARVPLALAAVALVLFAPRAYSLDGFLQAGFYPQVASELFVVAAWWALARWWRAPAPGWMAFAGLMGAAVFLVWPIWIGPLMLAAAAAVLTARDAGWPARVRAGALGVVPCTVVAALHLSQHAAWLRIAGASGAVPAFVPGMTGWLLIALAVVGAARAWARPSVRVTLWFAGAVVLQAFALWLLARARGAATPYMAMKMIYLGVHPAAVLGAIGLGAIVQRIRAGATGAAWAAALVICAVGVRTAVSSPAPPPIVDVDLDAMGRWARAALPPACVDYLVDNAEQAYWLHLAVMGQPRSSPRTADIDGYTANRAVGRWIDGSALPYAIARRDLLPGEVVRDAEVVRSAGAAVVIRRPGVACPLPIAH
jgi:hypothetical protein